MKRYHTLALPYRDLLFLAVCSLLFSLLYGCAPVDFGSFKESYVVIHPDRSLPPMVYHFYSDRDALTIHPCDGMGNYEGYLPMGTYHTIATNINTPNVLFKDLQNYEEASVHALPDPSAARAGDQLFLFPGDVYSVSMSDVQVNGRDTVFLSPHPLLLTRHIVFRIFLSDTLEEEVGRVSGLLRGIQPSAKLFNSLLADAKDPEASGTRFVTHFSGEAREAEVSLFGITYPNYGESYTNTLFLSLERLHGAEYVYIDMTHIISSVMDENEGDLPLHLSLKIDIRDTDIGLKAEVTSWEYSGSGTGEVYPD